MDLNQTLEEWENRFSRIEQQHQEELAAILKMVYTWYMKTGPSPTSQISLQRASKTDTHLRGALIAPTPTPLMNMTGRDQLQQLDRAFLDLFRISDYFDVSGLRYPTVYCETLKEFFEPIVQSMDVSPTARDQALQDKIKQAEDIARERPGAGIWGYNLTGDGCYINGWLIGTATKQTPKAAFEIPDILPLILATAVHEKLGHGFLSVYSELGKSKSQLGAYILDVASRFGIDSVANAADHIRFKQAGLLNFVSQYVEEGWSTWLESFFNGHIINRGMHPKYSLEALVTATEKLPWKNREDPKIKASMLMVLHQLFEAERLSPNEALDAVKILYWVNSRYSQEYGQFLSQPLPYVVGELLMTQIEAKAGYLCVPYAALIAANIQVNFQEIGLADLHELMLSEPGVNPDARLALISKRSFEIKNDIRHFAGSIEEHLSMRVPGVLKVKGEETKS